MPISSSPQPDNAKRDLTIKALMTLVAAAVIAGCSSTAGSLAPHGRTTGTSNVSRALPAESPTPAPAETQSCSDGDSGDASCTVQRGSGAASNAPSAGLTPQQLRSAYGLPPASSGAAIGGPTVAIVDAYNDKSAESDLATYRSQFGLPPCTSKNGCFSIDMMTGAKIAPGQYKKLDGGVAQTTWNDEIALDLAMASAACPICKIALVEAGGQDLDSLAVALNAAAALNPSAIGVSWGVVENGNVANIDADAQAALQPPGHPDRRRRRRPRSGAVPCIVAVRDLRGRHDARAVAGYGARMVGDRLERQRERLQRALPGAAVAERIRGMLRRASGPRRVVHR